MDEEAEVEPKHKGGNQVWREVWGRHNAEEATSELSLADRNG